MDTDEKRRGPLGPECSPGGLEAPDGVPGGLENHQGPPLSPEPDALRKALLAIVQDALDALALVSSADRIREEDGLDGATVGAILEGARTVPARIRRGADQVDALMDRRLADIGGNQQRAEATAPPPGG